MTARGSDLIDVVVDLLDTDPAEPPERHAARVLDGLARTTGWVQLLPPPGCDTWDDALDRGALADLPHAVTTEGDTR